MHYHCQRWHSQVATGRDEMPAAVGIECMGRWSGDSGTAQLFEPDTHCLEYVRLLQCWGLSVRLTWDIVHTEIDRKAGNTSMERTRVVA